MTGFLVVMGLVAVVLGIIYRKQTVPALKWLWNSVLFLGSFTMLVAMIVLSFVTVVLSMVMVAVSMTLLGATVATVVLYLPVWLVALVIWAISRKRDVFDKVNKPVGFFISSLFAGVEYMFYKLDDCFDLLDKFLGSLDGLFDVATASAKVAAVPFVWLSRKLWPRG